MRLFQEISGQIFEVDEKMLQFLDDFEEHPNVYQRVEVNVMVESGMLTVRGQESVKKVPKLFFPLGKYFLIKYYCLTMQFFFLVKK